MNKNINRRQFFSISGKTAAIAALASLPFSSEKSFAANNSVSRTVKPAYNVDVLVCGGGPAGIAAAINAARLGCSTMLVERYGRLGGMGVHARVYPLMGSVVDNVLVQEIHRKVGKYDPEIVDIQFAEMLEQAGVKILLHCWVTEPVMKRNRIAGIHTISKQGEFSINAKMVIDATGDADIAFAAGVPCQVGRGGDGLVQPMSIMFSVDGIAANAQFVGSEEAARETMVGGETWESVTTRAQHNGELPETVGVVRTYAMERKGKACVNATQINGLIGTKVEDLTQAELACRRQALKIVEFMRRRLPGYENCYIDNMPAVVGVRETRRITGLVQLTREDLLAGRKWDDAIVRGANFVIDIHNPAGSGQAENQNHSAVQGQAAQVQPYDIPARCCIPQKVENLLVAGRCISGTHEAHASYRVQNICMATGAGVGAMAAVSLKDGVTPEKINIEKVQKVLFYK